MGPRLDYTEQNKDLEYMLTDNTPIATRAGLIRKAAQHCSDWEKGLKILFPDAFALVMNKEEEWYDDWY